MMLARQALYPGLYARLARPGSGYRTWFTYERPSRQLDHLGAWPWIGAQARLLPPRAPRGRRHERVGHRHHRRRGNAGAGSGKRAATTIVVPCTGKPVAVPAGAVGTWMVPTKTPPAGLRLTIAGSAPLPAFAAYAVRALPEGPDSPKTIQTSCRGPQAVTLRVFHTPVP